MQEFRLKGSRRGSKQASAIFTVHESLPQQHCRHARMNMLAGRGAYVCQWSHDREFVRHKYM